MQETRHLEASIVSTDRLEAMLAEADEQLSAIQPRIEEIEASLEELKSLRQLKQKLLTLKLSLRTLLETSQNKNEGEFEVGSDASAQGISLGEIQDFTIFSASKTFFPELALEQAGHLLKQKASLNHDLFKAVVFQGGKASTEAIKQFLVESGVKQPQTGEGFDNVPLTEISSRANYLVRKGLLQSIGRGVFVSRLGWTEAS